MKKNLTILLTVILMMVTGATLSYAAFPLAHDPITATSNSGQPAGNETEVQQQTAQMISVAKGGDHKSGHSSGKSQVIALILVLCLGSLGIHRFYLGYTWQGVVQLLTLGGCGIWALIDLIRIITGDLQPKNGKYDKTL